jgi:hypothetical protein
MTVNQLDLVVRDTLKESRFGWAAAPTPGVTDGHNIGAQARSFGNDYRG